MAASGPALTPGAFFKVAAPTAHGTPVQTCKGEVLAELNRKTRCSKLTVLGRVTQKQEVRNLQLMCKANNCPSVTEWWDRSQPFLSSG